jgi:hypothetical protein
LTGELWIGALPGLVLLTAAVTAALSGLGVWLSVPRRPSQLANSEAMGAVFAFLGVVWGAWWLPSRFLSESHWLPELLLRQAVVLTPPALVGLLTCTPAEARWFLGRSDASWWLAQSAAGMALAVGAAWWLWRRACAAADREFRPRPERRKEVPT